ncbi:DUF4380 domain-containing protein [bacterium]|nr:DUF4380 domain-containing protein [bacterium]
MKCFIQGVLVLFVLFDMPTLYSQVIYCRNGSTEIGILPDVGGRIVILRRDGCENLLKSVPETWNEPESERPVPDALHPVMKAYMGQIVWLGPQSDWWIQQNVNQTLKDQAAQWPPDPYLIYGKYRILSQSDSSILIQGSESPVSGLQLQKEIRIDCDGKVHFLVTGQNVRDENVCWDLWCNLRTSGFNRCYVPVLDTSDIRISHEYVAKKTVPYAILNGYFTFIPDISSKERQTAKAFIYPNTGKIAAFQNNQVLLIHFERLNRSQIHPNQGHVEIYQDTGPFSDALLELEHHAAYLCLSPGDSLSAEEVWEIVPYMGEASPDAHTVFLRSIE